MTDAPATIDDRIFELGHMRTRAEKSERLVAALLLMANGPASAICESLADLRLLIDREQARIDTLIARQEKVS